MGVEVLSGSLTPRHKKDVIPGQSRGIEKGNKAVYDHGKCYPEVTDGRTEGYVLPVHVDDDLCQRDAEEIRRGNHTTRDKCKEEPVVTPPNAVVDPDTVMVLCLNAVVAKATVMGSRWTPDVARLAVLCGHLHGRCCLLG